MVSTDGTLNPSNADRDGKMYANESNVGTRDQYCRLSRCDWMDPSEKPAPNEGRRRKKPAKEKTAARAQITLSSGDGSDGGNGCEETLYGWENGDGKGPDSEMPLKE